MSEPDHSWSERLEGNFHIYVLAPVSSPDDVASIIEMNPNGGGTIFGVCIEVFPNNKATADGYRKLVVLSPDRARELALSLIEVALKTEIANGMRA